MSVEFANFDRIALGERRVPDADLSCEEAALAWTACVMSKFILEKDIAGDLFYSPNPEHKDFVSQITKEDQEQTKTPRHPLQGEFRLPRRIKYMPALKLA